MTYIVTTAQQTQQTQQDAIAAQQAVLASKYKTTVFDKIAQAAGQGISYISITLLATDYTIVKPVLAYYSYTVGPAVPISTNSTYVQFAISWPIPYANNVPSIGPSNLKMIKGCAYSATFSLTDSTFTPSVIWTQVNGSGSLPPGMTLTSNVIMGTPTTTGDGFFELRVTDNSGASISTVTDTTIFWNVTAVMEDNVSISIQNSRSASNWHAR